MYSTTSLGAFRRLEFRVITFFSVALPHLPLSDFMTIFEGFTPIFKANVLTRFSR